MDVSVVVTLASVAVTVAGGLFGWAWKNLLDDRNYWRAKFYEVDHEKDAREADLAAEKTAHLTTKDDLLKQINELRTEVGTLRVDVARLTAQLGPGGSA